MISSDYDVACEFTANVFCATSIQSIPSSSIYPSLISTMRKVAAAKAMDDDED
jgi:hypothetical protein